MSQRVFLHVGKGDDRKTYEVELGKLMNVELIAVEKMTGLALDPLLMGLAEKSLTATTALVWIMRKRQEPRLKFDEVTFSLDEVLIEFPDLEDDEDEPAGDESAVPKAEPGESDGS